MIASEMREQQDVERTIAKYQRHALPIVHVGTLQTPKGTIPEVIVDVRRRPDVADLLRAHVDDQTDGQFRSEWTFLARHPSTGKPFLGHLDVQFQRPVSCRFELLFDFDKHRRFLERVAETGRMVIRANHQKPRLLGKQQHVELLYELNPYDTAHLTGILDALREYTDQRVIQTATWPNKSTREGCEVSNA